MLTIHFANRLETLAEGLADRLDAAGGSVFDADEVIVPSAAMRQHLTLLLARRHGICAGVRFSFLAQWLWRQTASVVPGVAEASPFDVERLLWRVHAAFGDAAWRAPHPRLAAYLERGDALMRYELATAVAGLFDQYLIYRPDWLAAWARGEAAAECASHPDHDWQAALWHRLLAETALVEHDPGERLAAAVRERGAELVSQGLLPATVHVFALPAMPPTHLELLQLLSACIEVHVHALNPCREYWFDVVDRRRLAWLRARATSAQAAAAVAHHEVGHSLLAAWGPQTQAHMSLLVAASGESVLDDAQFTEPGTGHLLGRLQTSILDLAELEPGSVPLAEDDRSIEVHVCHSRVRELEVLHDRLLALFTGPAPPAPHEVLVVTPDLEATAPLVDAVFGTAPRERHIPYRVTGRARSRANTVASVLLGLLALLASRAGASEVHALLRQPPVARHFGLDEADLERVHGWLHTAGVHWALDGAHRDALALPAVGRHSLDDGIDRLFLGYALPAEADTPFDGRLPAGNPEGTEAQALGALWSFAQRLAALRAQAARPRPGPAWIALLHEALADFVAPAGDEADELREVHEALAELQAGFEAASHAEPLPLEVLRAALERALDDSARGGVPGGAVTFASMSSLRGLPYRVVCAIGLDDRAFPRQARPLEFDLMAQAPRAGDRQRRDDERNLFLDLLLAARERVHLSYVGRSVRDNAALPPSVLVAELLDALVPAVAEAPQNAASLARAKARLVVEHPLQAFAEEAFRADADPRLRSFRTEYAQALRERATASAAVDPAPSTVPAAEFAPTDEGDDDLIDEADAADSDGDLAGDRAAAPFFTAPLPAPGPEWDEVPIERLARFLRNPCRFLLEQRLGLELPRPEEALQDDEPFVADGLGRHALAERLLPALLQGEPRATLRERARAGIEWPAGALGAARLERELDTLEGFATELRGHLAAPTLPPLSMALQVPSGSRVWQVRGALAELRETGLVHHRCGRLRPADLLAAWLRHLMLCAAAPAGVQPRTTLCTLDGTQHLKPVVDPQPVLATLLDLYERGLREPVAFFPQTAWAYVENRDHLGKARGAWQPSPYRPGAEGADAAYRLAWRGQPDPLEARRAEFHAWAHAVYDPLRECMS